MKTLAKYKGKKEKITRGIKIKIKKKERERPKTALTKMFNTAALPASFIIPSRGDSPSPSCIFRFLTVPFF